VSRERRLVILARVGVGLIAVGCLVAVVVPAGIRWDFANFYDAGHKALVGQWSDLYDPDVPIAGAPPQGRLAYWGLPLTALLFAPLALLPPGVALVVFKIENVLAIGAALLLLWRRHRRFAGDDPAARAAFAGAFVGSALLFQPLWTVFRVGGQTTPTVLLLLVLGLGLHTEGRTALASLCFVAAVLIKPSFAPGLALVALLSGPRFLAWSAAWGLGGAALSVAVAGFDLHLDFVRQILSGAGKSVAWMHNSALTVPLENLRLLSDPHPSAQVRPRFVAAGVLAVRVAVLALFVHLLLVARRWEVPQKGRRHFVFLVGILFSLLVSPVVWEHYLALLFIPLAFLLASWQRLSRGARRLVTLLLVSAFGQNLVLVLWVEAHFHPQTALGLLVVGLFKAAPLLLALILVWRYRDDLLHCYSAPAWTA